MSIEQAQQNGAGEKAASANRSGSALANGAHVAALTGDYILEAMHAAAAGDASKPQAEPPAEDFDTTPAPAMQHKAAMREITARLEQCGRYAGFPSVTHIADGGELQTASVQLAKALIPSDRQIMRLKGLEIISEGGAKDSVSYTLRCCEPSTLDDENEVAKLRFELDKTRRELGAEKSRVKPFNEADAQLAALRARIDALEAENAALRAKPAVHTEPAVKIETVPGETAAGLEKRLAANWGLLHIQFIPDGRLCVVYQRGQAVALPHTPQLVHVEMAS